MRLTTRVYSNMAPRTMAFSLAASLASLDRKPNERPNVTDSSTLNRTCPRARVSTVHHIGTLRFLQLVPSLTWLT